VADLGLRGIGTDGPAVWAAGSMGDWGGREMEWGFTRLHCAKTVEQMEILFGVNTWGTK